MKALRAVLVCSLLLVSCAALYAGDRNTLTFFVAPDGNDEWSGRRATINAEGTDGPLASLQGAQAAIRAIANRTMPVQVYVRGGDYFMCKPLVLTPEDSGSAKYPVTYKSYPFEQPVFYGGLVFKKWHVRRGGTFTALLPQVWREEWVFDQLWVNGERRTLKPEPEGTKRLGLAGAAQIESLEAGEWYLDRASNNLYYRPLKGEKRSCLTIAAPVTSQLIVFKGDAKAGKYVEFVNVLGLDFMYTAEPTGDEAPVPAVIQGIGARNCSIIGCQIAHTGMTGIWFDPDMAGNVIEDNELIDVEE